MNHLWGSKCEKVSELSSQKILDRIDNFYSVNFSKQTDELPFWKWSSTFDPYFKRAILASNSLNVPLLYLLNFHIFAKYYQTLKEPTEKNFWIIFDETKMCFTWHVNLLSHIIVCTQKAQKWSFLKKFKFL